MKLTRRIVALVMVVLMLVPMAFTLNASAAITANGAVYMNYKVNGANVNLIKFSTNDNLFPMAYATQAGKTNYLQDHVNAAIAEGYTVVGAINASFFDMSTGDPCSRLITDGKIVFDHTGLNDVLTVFYGDGSNYLLNSVGTDYALTLGNNTIATNAIGMVNKDYSACNMTSETISTRYHYYDSDMGALNGSENTGYEILCKKLNGTEIGFGQTLQGEVISVTYGYYGKTVVTAKDQFVLFVKDNGTYKDYATALSAGDSVSLTPKGTDSWGNEVLSKANSAIGSTYWLVRDGVDFTDTTDTIIHSTSLKRAWTAFGWDDNGNYYFYTSEEYGITLKQVADDMISKGCTNVLRVDGGGSTTMWVEGQGIVENAGPRMVVDCILIVKRDPIDVDIPTIENTSGIEYTTSQLYRQGDASNNWGYAEDNPITYPDETGFGLVDGYLGSSDYNDAAWMGFSSNCPDHKTNGYSYINYDLGSSKYIGKLSAYYGTNALGGGIGAPLSFEVLVSDDGVNYTTVRSGAASNTGISGNSAVGCTDLIVNRTARYVQLRMVCNGWGFLCETEFSWATEQEPEGGNTDPGTHTHKATGDWIFNETNHWKKCSCGSITNKVSHSFKDGKCSVCGYSKGEEIPEPEYSGLRGDINLDETIGMTDYILLKRYYFGTYTLNEKQILHGDLNEDGTIGMTDYILLKRVYFNTYTLKNPYIYK